MSTRCVCCVTGMSESLAEGGTQAMSTAGREDEELLVKRHVKFFQRVLGVLPYGAKSLDANRCVGVSMYVCVCEYVSLHMLVCVCACMCVFLRMCACEFTPTHVSYPL